MNPNALPMISPFTSRTTYGAGLLSYDDLKQYMSTLVVIDLPRYRHSFAQFVRKVPSKKLCDDVAGVARARSLPVIERSQMEAAYVQFLFMKFEDVTSEELEGLVAEYKWMKGESEKHARDWRRLN
jgi:hypothetical protein